MADARSEIDAPVDGPVDGTRHPTPAGLRVPDAPLAREPGLADRPPRAVDAESAADRDVGSRTTPAEAAAAEEEAFCELLDDAYVRTDVYGVVRKANAAAADLLGRPALWIAGKPLFTFVDDEGRHALRMLVNGLREADGLRRWTLELRATDGPPVSVDATVLPVRSGGEVVGARWLLRRHGEGARPASGALPVASQTTTYFAEFLARATGGLSDVLDHRELLRAVAQHAVPALCDWCVVDLVTEDGRFERVAVTHTAIEDPAHQAVVEAAVPASGGDHPVAVAARTLRTRFAHDDTLAAWQVAEGPRIHAGFAVPMVARGSVLGVVSFLMARSRRPVSPLSVSTAEELTRRAALGADNALLYRRAVRASEAKSAFLGTISHELRTPLTAVIGYSELLADGLAGPLEERQAEFVRRIRDSGDHLLHLVEEVLGFARLEANEERAACEPVRVAALARQACAVVEPQARRRGLQVACDVELPEEFTIESDPTKLRQILVNLLGNAVKFTDEGGVRLHAALDRSRAHVELSVRDTGIGIPTELLRHVFDPFWQVEQTTTRARGGAGLGLSVVRHLARLLGGDVHAESEPGRGSCFRVTLPRAAPRAPVPD